MITRSLSNFMSKYTPAALVQFVILLTFRVMNLKIYFFFLLDFKGIYELIYELRAFPQLLMRRSERKSSISARANAIKEFIGILHNRRNCC